MESIVSMGVGGNVSGEDGDPLKSQEMMYKEVFQAVILYGRKVWVFTDPMMKVLEGFTIVLPDILWV